LEESEEISPQSAREKLLDHDRAFFLNLIVIYEFNIQV
jgi:hypothetical protein